MEDLKSTSLVAGLTVITITLKNKCFIQSMDNSGITKFKIFNLKYILSFINFKSIKYTYYKTFEMKTIKTYF